MGLRQTDEHLEKMLIEEGFTSYPFQANKYWNEDGRVLWTDGSLYKENTNESWSTYDSDVINQTPQK